MTSAVLIVVTQQDRPGVHSSPAGSTLAESLVVDPEVSGVLLSIEDAGMVAALLGFSIQLVRLHKFLRSVAVRGDQRSFLGASLRRAVWA